MSDMSDLPNEDASPAEIARWMEEDFWKAVAGGMEAIEDDDNDE